MRRLPVFFVIDVSESMVGPSLYNVEEALSTIIGRLRTDPYALDTIWLSVIVFAGAVRTLVPLIELAHYYTIELPVGGGTSLGKALDHLMSEIDRSVEKTTTDKKGDWKPIVFLMTDGWPTDTVSAPVTRWNAKFRKKANLVAVSIGSGADLNVLSQITEEIVIFENTGPNAFDRFIQWITLSIQMQSRSVGTGADEPPALAKTDDVVIKRVSLDKPLPSQHNIDERFAVFTARCQNKGLPYLIKYERQDVSFETRDPELAALLAGRQYILQTTFPLK